jgi:hypothetical protein
VSAARRAFAAAAVALLLAAGTGCTDAPPRPEQPEPVRPQWKPVELPMPPGPPGRPMLREAAVCGDRWYAAGAVITDAGETRPALWATTDPTAAAGWAVVPVEATDYYAVRSILYAIGCRDGEIAVIGARGGGGHGNPRVRTFYETPRGLHDVPSTDFQLYGGPAQVSVNRMAGGPAGWLIAGNRESGAAVWLSPDATAFTIVEGAPVLASDAGLSTAANDAVAVDGGWLVAGSGRAPDRIDRDPLAWTTPDGRTFTRVPLPGGPDDEAVQRVLRTADGMVAVGVAGGGFAAWHGDASGAAGWRAAGRFGATGSGTIAGVESAAVVDGHVLAATVAADGHRLWAGHPAADAPAADAPAGSRPAGGPAGDGGWRPVDLPAPVPPGGFTAAAVAGRGDTMLLLTDDGVSARAWVAAFPPS